MNNSRGAARLTLLPLALAFAVLAATPASAKFITVCLDKQVAGNSNTEMVVPFVVLDAAKDAAVKAWKKNCRRIHNTKYCRGPAKDAKMSCTAGPVFRCEYKAIPCRRRQVPN